MSPPAEDLIASTAETTVLDADFKTDLVTYLAGLKNSQISTLEDLININDANADLEFAPGECYQQTLLLAVQTTGKNASGYTDARAQDLDLDRTRGIDATLDKYYADALVLPTDGYASGVTYRFWDQGRSIGKTHACIFGHSMIVQHSLNRPVSLKQI